MAETVNTAEALSNSTKESGRFRVSLGSELMDIAKLFVSVPYAFVALIETLLMPVAVGVPVIVEPEKVRPVGKVPDVKLIGFVPLAVIVYEKA